MAKKQFQQSGSHTISSKRILGTALALLIFFLLLMSVIRLAEKYFAIRTRNQELRQEQIMLNQKENDLATTNAFLATPEGTEQSLRERYDYLKPGEQMIIINPDTSVTPTLDHQTTVGHWWSQLLHGLGIQS
jgi:cell division protein FtsB